MRSRYLVPAMLAAALLAACSETPTSPKTSNPTSSPGPVQNSTMSTGVLIAVTALDFGDVPVGTTSPQQTVKVTNVGPSPIVMSGTGGAPGGSFGSTQDCQGNTLNPGDSCHMLFTFSPTAAGPATATSSGTWNGQPFSITLKGNGTTPTALFRITSSALAFGPVTVGTTSPQQTVDITNITSAPIVMSGAGGAPGGDFNGVQDCQGTTLNPGDTCHMFFTFSPNAAGPATATSNGSWNGQAFSIPMTGTGVSPSFRITPSAIDFGEVNLGSTSPQVTVDITNAGTVSVIMSGAGGAPGGDFNGVQDCQGKTLNVGDTCHMFFTYSPSATGPATATSNGSWNGQSFSIPLKGTGIAMGATPSAQFRITTAAVNFGPVQVGTTSPQQTVDITNITAAPIVMSGAGGAPGGDFSGVQDCQGQTLNPGATCHMFFTFSPSAAGPASSTSNGSWNGQAFSIPLSGTGVPPTFLITPVGIDFGEVALNTTSPQVTVNVTNVGLASVVMSGAGGAPGGEFNGVQDCQGKTLNVGDTCHMFFTFSPTVAGPATATSSGSWNGQSFNIALKGSGGAAPQQQFLITPIGFDFGLIPVGTTSPQQTTLVTNVSSAPIVMSGTGGAPGGEFGSSQDCQGKTLNPGDACHMFYTFAPTAVGPATATASGTWNGQAYSIALQGGGGFTITGFFPPVHVAFPALQTVQAGRAIPLKFSLGGDQGLDIFATGFPVSWDLDCSSLAISDPVPTETPGNSGLHFDPSTNTYNYVWKTDKGWSGTCRQVEMEFVDGSVLRANFQFR